MKYTDEKGVLLLVAALKAYNIRRVIVSPGTTHTSFVASIQHDDFFQLYSCVDERSAAYMACGMATETNEPIVIACTGATAPREYLPGLTEAYYRKLPILAVCGHRGVSQIGHLHDQQLDRRNEPTDTARVQVWLPFVKDGEDELLCRNEINRAILSLNIHGGGPAIINLCTHYSRNLNVHELPPFTKVGYYTSVDTFPELPQGRIAITIGSHRLFSPVETQIIDSFCASNDAVVICDHTSGYYGHYAVQASLVLGQKAQSDLGAADLVIRAGEISGDSYGVLSMWSPILWRVGEDGEYRNTNGNTTKVFNMSLAEFCKHYLIKDSHKEEYLQTFKTAYQDIYSKIPDSLPFSNIWIAQQLIPQIPQGSSVYLGIFNSLRSWNWFELADGVEGASNVGGFGIDGILSSAIGRALANPKHLTYCILGDLSFFYDMNAIGNRHIDNNLRVLIINNGLGDEFRLSNSPSYQTMGEEVRPYLAADGHFGRQSKSLVKGYAESLGYRYLCATTKEDFLANMDVFTNSSMEDSIIFEVMIKPEDDTKAFDIIQCLLPQTEPSNTSISKSIKNKVKSYLGEEKINAIRTLLK